MGTGSEQIFAKNEHHYLDDANLVGDVEGISVFAEFNVCLLLSILGSERITIYKNKLPNQSVNFVNFNIVQSFNGISNLNFVCEVVDDEYQSIVVFDLFHGAFRGQRVLDNSELVKFIGRRSGFSWILGLSSQSKSVRSSEVSGSSNFSSSLGVSSLLDGLFDFQGFGSISLLQICWN